MSEDGRKGYIADSARAFAARRIGKREFLRRLGRAGVGVSGFPATLLGGSRPFSDAFPPRALAQTRPSADMTKWLRDVGSTYKGTKIRFVSEPTPPTIVASKLAREEFT